jgi:hypothetical protein
MWTCLICLEASRRLAGRYRVADAFVGEDGRLGGDVANKAADPDVRHPFAGEGSVAAR